MDALSVDRRHRGRDAGRSMSAREIVSFDDAEDFSMSLVVRDNGYRVEILSVQHDGTKQSLAALVGLNQRQVVRLIAGLQGWLDGAR